MAAAYSVMEKRPLIKEGGKKVGKEVKDMLREERMARMEAGLEVAVVFLRTVRDLGAVEVILGGVGVSIKIIPVGEGVDLLTMEQISKMYVVTVAMNTVE